MIQWTGVMHGRYDKGRFLYKIQICTDPEEFRIKLWMDILTHYTQIKNVFGWQKEPSADIFFNYFIYIAIYVTSKYCFNNNINLLTMC